MAVLQKNTTFQLSKKELHDSTSCFIRAFKGDRNLPFFKSQELSAPAEWMKDSCVRSPVLVQL